MAAIKSVSLDVGWTLAYPRRSIWQIFADVAGDAGKNVDPKELETLVRQLWSSGQQAAVEHFRSGATYEDSDEQFSAAFQQMGALVFMQFDVPGDHAELTQRFFEAFWTEENWKIFPEVLATINELRRRGLRVGVLSNAPTNLPLFLDRLGISPHLDFAVVSAAEGVKKPDRRIFETALARAGVEAQEAMHVGDMYVEDILGGRAAGLQTLLMERGGQALFPSYRESEGRDLDEGHVVTDLRQILDRVG